MTKQWFALAKLVAEGASSGQAGIVDVILAAGWMSEGAMDLEGDTLTIWPPGHSSYSDESVTLSIPDILAGNYVLLGDANTSRVVGGDIDMNTLTLDYDPKGVSMGDHFVIRTVRSDD